MSLLREIQSELSRSGVDVVAVLRKCKILAARLGSPEFSRWVDWELNGYPESEAVPEYRKVTVTYFASFVSMAWKIQKAPVPLFIIPEDLRDSFRFVHFRGGIAKAASFAQAKGLVGWQEPELILLLQGKMYPEMNCQGVWAETAHTEFEQLVSAVTSRILDFSLKLEAENPSAREALPKQRTSVPRKTEASCPEH